ncbi:hypothetical protein ES332_A10G118500v1 [Gossypium tomentosum]|uniref:Uncharacterized protein n=1 Tax=Gossypium tomentosum TaxID=34277 RepID=A0A5D2NNW0_GOSTO|nr:hypothetical protein ES332_A10G118500v1 [Gossypium tomentosum]
MGVPLRSGNVIKPSEMTMLTITTFAGVFLGFLIGVSFPTLSLTKINFPSSLFLSIDLTYIEDKHSGLSTRKLFSALSSLKDDKVVMVASNKSEKTKIWIPTNPRGAERLPPGIITSESDFYLHRLWGQPSEDLTIKPKYLVTFTVGYNQKSNRCSCEKGLSSLLTYIYSCLNLSLNVQTLLSKTFILQFSENFTIMLFHYDGLTTEWDEFEWSKRAIHVSVQKQTKWWYAKRFLHPDIAVPYVYIFIWDEDLGVENFDAEEYIKLVRRHGLEISQPGLDANSASLTWAMTRKRDNTEVHMDTEERPGWCSDQHLPPCASFVEIMATVFSRDAWRCVWHMIQNDLVHGWGLDFALRKCVEPSHEKIGVVDAQWIVHQGVPSLGNQGQPVGRKASWQGVRERCRKEWTMFQDRMTAAEKAYYEAVESNPF